MSGVRRGLGQGKTTATDNDHAAGSGESWELIAEVDAARAQARRAFVAEVEGLLLIETPGGQVRRVPLDAQVLLRRRHFCLDLALHSGKAGLPPFVFDDRTPYRRGWCFSCNDEIGQSALGRCWRCALAWRLSLLPAPRAVLDASRPADRAASA